MQIDEVVWSVINQGHCSFKIKTESQNFCRNKHNVTGLCNRQSCPLANSNYATILEEKGVCYLYIKTIERSHKPRDLWEKIKLDKNYAKALEQIDTQLAYWPKFLIHKNKQRLTKLRQMIIRMRKLKLQGYQEFSQIKQKAERRDKIREQKALLAADIEGEIENQLLERLQQGTYGGIYNFNEKAFEKVMDEKEKDSESNSEFDEEMDDLESDDEGYIYDDNSEEEEEDYQEEKKQVQKQYQKQIQPKKNKKVTIEYEEEQEIQQKKQKF